MLIGAIRGGVQGALMGLGVGILMGLLLPLAVAGAGIGLAGALGFIGVTITETTGIFIVGTLLTGWSVYRSGNNFLRADNAREKWASGLEVLFSLGFWGYGTYKYSQIPNLPPNSPSGSNGPLPASKQSWGNWLSEVLGVLRGERVVAREVQIETTNATFRVDTVFRNIFTGRFRWVESKFGPTARWNSPSQRTGYQEFSLNGGQIRTNKLSAFGINRGTNLTGPQNIRIDNFNGADVHF